VGQSRGFWGLSAGISTPSRLGHALNVRRVRARWGVGGGVIGGLGWGTRLWGSRLTC